MFLTTRRSRTTTIDHIDHKRQWMHCRRVTWECKTGDWTKNLRTVKEVHPSQGAHSAVLSSTNRWTCRRWRKFARVERLSTRKQTRCMLRSFAVRLTHGSPASSSPSNRSNKAWTSTTFASSSSWSRWAEATKMSVSSCKSFSCSWTEPMT